MKMKKIFSLLLVALLVAFATGCDMSGMGGTGNGNGNGNTGTSSDDYTFLTPYTDTTKLNLAWEGKDFIEDGIGEVTYNQGVDGDTTIFRLNGKNITTRYLGINTPESTYRVDPWGFKASKFTKSILNTATTIVLVAEGERQDSNGRYLAWVWYRTSDTADFRLLNLEIVENAYSVNQASGTSFERTFNDAAQTVSKLRYRVWGEVDQDYDASTIGESLTIKEIRERYATLDKNLQESYQGKVIRTTGIVVKDENKISGYLEYYDPETELTYNVYVYGGFSQTILQEGREVYVQGRIGYYNGALQITSYDKDNSGVLDFGSNYNREDHIYNLTGAEYAAASDNLQSKLVRMTNLTVYKTYTSPNGGFTLTLKDENNYTIELRVQDSIMIKGENQNLAISSGSYFNGKVFESIVAIVGFYDVLEGSETMYDASGIQLVVSVHKLTDNDLVLKK